MKICYGISNGPYLPRHRDLTDESPYLWHAGPNEGVFVQSRDDLMLEVSEYDSTKSMPVEITLRHKGSHVPLVRLHANSYQLHGKPELVWNDGYPHVAGVPY